MSSEDDGAEGRGDDILKSVIDALFSCIRTATNEIKMDLEENIYNKWQSTLRLDWIASSNGRAHVHKSNFGRYIFSKGYEKNR